MRWYFAPSWWLPLKLLLFGWLVWGLGYSLFFGGLRALASARVVWAIPAAVNTVFAIIVFLSVAPLVVPLMLSPAVVYGMQMGGIPTAWQQAGRLRDKVGMTAMLLVGGYLAALVLAWIGVTVTGWIADINPCVAWRAGVTGSVRPGPECMP